MCGVVVRVVCVFAFFAGFIIIVFVVVCGPRHSLHRYDLFCMFVVTHTLIENMDRPTIKPSFLGFSLLACRFDV